MVRASSTTTAAVVPPAQPQPTIAGKAWSNQHSIEMQPQDPSTDSSFGEQKLFFLKHFSTYPTAVASSSQRNASSAVYQVSDPEIEFESRQSAASSSQRNAHQFADPETEFEPRRSSRYAQYTQPSKANFADLFRAGARSRRRRQGSAARGYVSRASHAMRMKTTGAIM